VQINFLKEYQSFGGPQLRSINFFSAPDFQSKLFCHKDSEFLVADTEFAIFTVTFTEPFGSGKQIYDFETYSMFLWVQKLFYTFKRSFNLMLSWYLIL